MHTRIKRMRGEITEQWDKRNNGIKEAKSRNVNKRWRSVRMNHVGLYCHLANFKEVQILKCNGELFFFLSLS
jgi:hypothetical protein